MLLLLLGLVFGALWRGRRQGGDDLGYGAQDDAEHGADAARAYSPAAAVGSESAGGQDQGLSAPVGGWGLRPEIRDATTEDRGERVGVLPDGEQDEVSTLAEEEDPDAVDTAPTRIESEEPTSIEWDEPTGVESDEPTQVESDEPTGVESDEPTQVEWDEAARVESDEPTRIEWDEPTRVESDEPTRVESDEPTRIESDEPTSMESDEPTRTEWDDETPSGRHAAVEIDEPEAARMAFHLPLDDPSEAPEGYPVKADTQSGLYWTPDSGLYDDARAEI